MPESGLVTGERDKAPSAQEEGCKEEAGKYRPGGARGRADGVEHLPKYLGAQAEEKVLLDTTHHD